MLLKSVKYHNKMQGPGKTAWRFKKQVSIPAAGLGQSDLNSEARNDCRECL